MLLCPQKPSLFAQIIKQRSLNGSACLKALAEQTSVCSCSWKSNINSVLPQLSENWCWFHSVTSTNAIILSWRLKHDALCLTVRLWGWRLRILDTVPYRMLSSREISFWVKPARRKPTICHPMECLVVLAFVLRNSWITYSIKIQTFQVYSCKRTQNLSSKRPCSLFRKIDK